MTEAAAKTPPKSKAKPKFPDDAVSLFQMQRSLGLNDLVTKKIREQLSGKLWSLPQSKDLYVSRADYMAAVGAIAEKSDR